ncbi:hypothetical protein D3C87_1638590 [compost metagenome]
MDEAVGVHVAAVTSVHPAVFQGGVSCLRLLPVAEHHVRTAHYHFPDAATGHFAVIGIDNAHFGAG